MTLVPVAPPQAVPLTGGFDYVTVDQARRRVYAAHTASRSLMIVDADTGKVLGQVRVGSLHGVAVDPATGHVYTGDGDSRTVSEVDPVAMRVLSSVDVDGPVDAIAYDPATGRIYADEDDGTRIFVIDAKTMKQTATVALPGHKPEYLAVDPQTHDVYQNITDLGEFVVVDAATLKVKQAYKTPVVTDNHPLQFDAAYRHVLVGGKNGVLAAYTPGGALIGTATMQPDVDQCDLDQSTHLIACSGNGMLTVLRDNPSGAPSVVSSTPAPPRAHTVGVDGKSGVAWLVWPQSDGDFVQGFHIAP